MPMRRGSPSLLFELVEQQVHEHHVVRALGFRQHDRVDLRAGAGDHFDDVVVAPLCFDVVDAHAQRARLPVERIDRVDDHAARVGLRARRDGVFEIEKHVIEIERRGFLHHLSAAAGHRQLAAASAADAGLCVGIGSRGHEMAPLRFIDSISDAEYPRSVRICDECSPNSGARVRTPPGVAVILIGVPAMVTGAIETRMVDVDAACRARERAGRRRCRPRRAPVRTAPAPPRLSFSCAFVCVDVHAEINATTSALCATRASLVRYCRMIDQIVASHRARERRPELVHRARDRDEAVAHREQSERAEQGVAVAFRAGDLVRVRILIDDAFAEREHGVVHRDVDELPLTGLVGAIHRGHEAECGQCGGQRIADAGSDLGRRTFRPGDTHHAAHRLRDDVVRRPVDVRALAGARVAEAADRGIDEFRVDRRAATRSRDRVCPSRRRDSFRPARRRRAPVGGSCPFRLRSSDRRRSIVCRD